jgi:hypothetical protein
MSDLGRIIEQLENADASGERHAAALELYRLADRGALPALRRRLLAERDLKALAGVIGALGRVGEAEDVDRLVPRYRRSRKDGATGLDVMIRRATVTALGNLKCPAALPLLREAQADDPEDEVRRAAVAAIATIEGATAAAAPSQSAVPAPASAERKVEAGAAPAAEQLVCDICDQPTDSESGYVLTTRQVAESEDYWKHAFTHNWSYVHKMDPTGAQMLPMLAQKQALQSSGWLVCPACAKVLTFDRAEARRRLQEWRHDRNKTYGAAPAGNVLVAALAAWKQLYDPAPAAPRPQPKAKANAVASPAPREAEVGSTVQAERLALKPTEAASAAKLPTDRLALSFGGGAAVAALVAIGLLSGVLLAPQKPAEVAAPQPTVAEQMREVRSAQQTAAAEHARYLKARGAIMVYTMPRGAMISVDGKEYDTSPVQIDGLGLGEHEIVALRPGFLRGTTSTIVRENDVSPVEIQLKREHGTLQVQTVPAGLVVGVFNEVSPVDGEEIPPAVQTAPCRLSLFTGTYRVETTTAAGETVAKSVTLAHDEEAKVVLNVESGSVEIRSAQECEVYLEGKLVGKTPYSCAEVPLGTRRYELRRAGYGSCPVELEVKAGVVAERFVILEEEKAAAPAEHAESGTGN